MAKREKILVGLMIIALIYAGFELIFSISNDDRSAQKTAHVDVDKVQELTAGTSQALKQVEMEEVQRYVLEAAATQWPQQNPFAPRPAPLEDEGRTPDEVKKKAEEDLPKLTYTGYLEMGHTRMAVINGLEYQTGEKLQQGTYILVNIQPNRVTLKNQENQAKISISYQGNDL
ncbi:GspB domain-containing protein [Desulfohalobium retbaense]|nr:GspB domain-containing protein [Desulfohalobium retbaense]